jgi:ABC-type Fe3+/spermidine/putrescine transport system ATPase subunit
LPHLEVRDRASIYGQLSVLNSSNLTLTKGEVVAPIRPSGSGKSTVLRALVGLTHPTAGEVLIDGIAIDSRKPAFIRRRYRGA